MESWYGTSEMSRDIHIYIYIYMPLLLLLLLLCLYIHSHAPAPQSYANFLLYPSVLQNCLQTLLGMGMGMNSLLF